MKNNHTVIIPQIEESGQGSNADTLIPMNVATLHSCYLCFRHAEREYDTTPCFLNGVFYPSVTRHLCKMHYQRVWQVLLESLKERVKTQERLNDEKGRVA